MPSGAPPPASGAVWTLPGSSEASTLTAEMSAVPDRQAAIIVALATMIPAPESRSGPAVMMSMALLVRTDRIWVGVRLGLADSSSPAIAAACGAAADVPKKGEPNPPTPVTLTPSAAVISGFCRSTPPVAVRLFGVYGVPSAWKKIRRGPSELNASITFDELNGCGNGPFAPPKTPAAGVAATPNAAAAALCPDVAPEVRIDSMLRNVPRWRNRGCADVFLTITIRSPTSWLASLISSTGS